MRKPAFKIPFRWYELAAVILTATLAWGLRGQHGHERGGAVAGALIGLSIAAVTGAPAWIGAAVIGSLCFSIGGALSYGRFVEPAYQGSWEAIRALFLVGASWGGLGGLGLGLGLSLPKYKKRHRTLLGIVLFLVWFTVDRLLWGGMSGPDDLKTRALMAAILLAVLGIVAAYTGLLRRDYSSLKLAAAGALGFGLGYPLAAWLQGYGQTTAIQLDWWKTSEHLIGFCGGLFISVTALSLESSWRLPRAVRPLERWLALTWFLFLLPAWTMANNLDYWISELTLFPLGAGKVVWGFLLGWLAFLAVWGWYEIRRGALFVTSWMPRHLRTLFLAYLWMITVIASLKTLIAGIWNPTPVIFFLLAASITILIQTYRPKSSFSK